MSSRYDLIARNLLQKPFADCTVQELEQLTAAQPYLAPAQYLLAKKMLDDQLPEARAQVQKAALYYHQPAAFDSFLNAHFPQPEVFYKEEETGDSFHADEPPLPINLSLPQHQTFNAAPALEAVVNTPIEAAPIEYVPHNVAETEPGDFGSDGTAAPLATETEPVTETAPAGQQEAFPAFEPFHTVDYFASQGIRLSQEEVAKDKVGRQLKSFTQWLKTMKRLPATEQLNSLDPNSERNVEHLAAHSVAEAEIVTEAMAEVWIKQGNLDKAAAVYHKLSLSNPSKRAYFAAKLESLKKNV